MSHKVFWLIIILATIVVGLLVYFKSQTPSGLPVGLAPVSSEKLTADYQTSASQVVSNYLQKRQTILQQGEVANNPELQTQTGQIAAAAKNDLLALRVPEQYRDLHLQLVLLFTTSELNALSDYAVVVDQDNKLDNLLSQYSWLSAEVRELD